MTVDVNWLDEKNCWICGSLADSAEHFFKASEVRGNWGRGGLVMTPAHGRVVKVQGAKSDLLKYRPSLCRTCNSTGTQAFDLAWDEFSHQIQADALRQPKGGSVYLPKLFSNARWRDVMLKVHLYWAKALGCYLAECNERSRVAPLREALLTQRACDQLILIAFSVPVGEEKVLQRSDLQRSAALDVTFFTYTLNNLSMAAALTPRPSTKLPGFTPWHPDRPSKHLRLHQLGHSGWKPDVKTARRLRESATQPDWHGTPEALLTLSDKPIR